MLNRNYINYLLKIKDYNNNKKFNNNNGIYFIIFIYNFNLFRFPKGLLNNIILMSTIIGRFSYI